MKPIRISGLVKSNGMNLYADYKRNHENRPTIVFLHDSLGCVQLWRDLPGKIAGTTQCNVLAYDRLGYGKSEPMPSHERPTDYLELEADVLNNLLITQQIDDAILFGHSDGGSIALIAASKYPERVMGVICEAAHIFVEDVTLQGIGAAMAAYKTTNLSERLAKYHGDKVDTIFKAWTETWNRSDFRNWNIEHFLPVITCPLLFIQGEADEYGTLQQVERTISQVRGRAEKYLIPKAGHTPHKEYPQQVIERSAEFISQLFQE